MPQLFSRSAQVVLDGTGAGEATIYGPGYDWVVTAMTVSTTTAVKVPQAQVYRNFVADINLLEGSYTGSNDSSNSRIVLQAGEGLVCQWSGGDAGATAVFRLSGVQYPPGRAPLE